MDSFLNAKDVSVQLKTSVRHIYYLVQYGYLAGVKVRRNWRFYQRDIKDYADGNDIRRVNKKTAADSYFGRYSENLTLFSINDSFRDKDRQASSLHRTGRSPAVPNKPKRLYKIPVKVFKSIKELNEARQLKFAFDVAS